MPLKIFFRFLKKVIDSLFKDDLPTGAESLPNFRPTLPDQA
jgi:hypothetical protein